MREMVKKDNEETTSSNGEEAEAWGTLEELLLACAVNRHGTTSWDSIAKELQKRMKHSFAFSPQNCKRKYVDLKRRFHLPSSAVAAADVRDEELLRMVDELRKLRVEELKREVQRHDLSIVSLQLKVKRLEEERENSSPMAEEPGEGGSDLRIEPDRNAKRTGEKADEPERSSPEKFDSAEDRSFNESNSSSHHNKASNKSSSRASPEKERESKSKLRKPEVKAEPDPVEKVEPVKESGSLNVSASRPAELGESASESKREQSSDVQSSASLSKKKRRRFRGLLGSGDELEAEEVSLSPANKQKSRPLVRFLETLRSHKHGSVFQRRLPSQETEKYRNVIRQHMDLDMVQSRLDNGMYSDCHPKFYRDLLLIFTNAVLFYRKSSAEHLAARELRKFVTNEVAQTTEKSEKIRPDLEANYSEPVVKKPRSSTTNMVVCRRRSSVSMQALSDSTKSKNEYKVENGTNEEKPVEKKDDNEKKLVTRDRSTLRSGGLRVSDNNNRKIISKEVTNKRDKVSSDQKSKINSNKGISVLKKKGVANFLKRMKQNSPSSQEKGNNDDSAEEDEGEEEREIREKAKSNAHKKRAGNSKRNNKNVDAVVSRRNPTRRGERETMRARRATDRPPKRKVAMLSSTPESRKGGRSSGRDGDEKSKKKPRR